MSKKLNTDEFDGMPRGERLLAEGLAYLLDSEVDVQSSEKFGDVGTRVINPYETEGDIYLNSAAEDAPLYGKDCE